MPQYPGVDGKMVSRPEWVGSEWIIIIGYDEANPADYDKDGEEIWEGKAMQPEFLDFANHAMERYRTIVAARYESGEVLRCLVKK